jgi:hypothetical protein
LASLLDNVRTLMGALAQTGNTLGPLLDAMHEVRPGVDATLRGNTLAVAAVLTHLDIGALAYPQHSSFPDLRDAQDFVGSLIQVLQVVQNRVQGGHR